MTGTTPMDTIICGDCLEEMRQFPDKHFDAIVTDPPAGINFMQKSWDGDKGGRNQWIAWMKDIAGECLRVIKPGGHALVWALPRTSHWTGMAWEEAGWEPRDKISHVFGSGFPKSLSIDKAIDKHFKAEREVIGKSERHAGKAFQVDKGWNENNLKSDDIDITAPATPAAKQWTGFGTSLKPAYENWWLFQKPNLLRNENGVLQSDWWLFRAPLDGCTIAENVLRWSTGALNIDQCRISTSDNLNGGAYANTGIERNDGWGMQRAGAGEYKQPVGRFPSNLIHDNSPEVLAEFAKAGERASKSGTPGRLAKNNTSMFGVGQHAGAEYADSGSAARFFMACEFTPADYAPIVYYAKASRAERDLGLSYGEYNGTEEHATNTNGKLRNGHPTVKPLALMRYLCKLITPPGGLILDPFGGSGTTGMAAIKEGFHYILIEQQEEYCEIARKRVAAVPVRLDRWAEAEG